MDLLPGYPDTVCNVFVWYHCIRPPILHRAKCQQAGNYMLSCADLALFELHYTKGYTTNYCTLKNIF